MEFSLRFFVISGAGREAGRSVGRCRPAPQKGRISAGRLPPIVTLLPQQPDAMLAMVAGHRRMLVPG